MVFSLSSWEMLGWLFSPSVIPWVGAASAVIAAITVETKTWLNSLGKGAARALRVAVCWLIITWLIGFVVEVNGGRGRGGREADDFGTGKSNDSPPAEPSVIISSEQFPSNLPRTGDLIIRFVPSPGNPSMAQNFSCDLIQNPKEKSTENKVVKIEIRAKDMFEFEKLFVAQLQNLNLQPKQRTILILRSPFPGENVLRRVSDKVRMIFPDATVMFDK